MSTILKRFGVDIKDLSTSPKVIAPKSQSGRILLYDGDGACYTHTNGVAKIETALRRLHTDIETHMLLAQCSSARVHLTPRGCFKNGRHLLNTVKPYQDNRNGKAKPPLLEVLRAQAQQYFEKHPHIEIISNYDIEADDGLMIDAFNMRGTVMISPDKDLRINPFESYNVEEGTFERLPLGDTFGWIERKFWLTPSGKTSSKMIGKGSKFFWAQMLMGDQADNVQGILTYNGKLCGEAGAYDVLSTIDDASEACNAVIDGYRAINQNVIAEGEAMWLLRNREDSVYRFIKEHELSPANAQFVEDCYNADWRLNLIEQFGGYEAAKAEGEGWGFDDLLNNQLLEYRRQHNIFEVGDKVVKTNPKLKFEFVREVKGVFKDGSVWLDYVGYKWKYPKVRHATDEEIKAGKRLEIAE